MTDFVMPSLGADMESGTVVEWRVKPGSDVKKGDVVVVVETHKGAIEVEIFDEGVISELCVEEGEQVPVGALLARLTKAGEQPVTPPPAPRAKEEGEKAEEATAEAKAPKPVEAPARTEPTAPGEGATSGRGPAAAHRARQGDCV